jgi:hypothetical protein
MSLLRVKVLSGPTLLALTAAALLPQVSFGQIPYGLGLSCNNSMVMGSYSAQMRIDDLNALANVNATAGKSAADAGFGSSSFSLSGKILGMSRFYFDGNGNIVGTVTATPTSSTPAGLANTSSTNAILVPAGTYNVNADCTATLTLNSGASSNYTFNGVVASGGDQILIQETDSSNPGVIGSLTHGPNFCGSNYNNPQSFAFAYNGITAGAAATSSAAATPATLYSNLGILTLDGNGNFTVTYWENKGGTISRVGTNSTPIYGTYSISNTNCTVSLTYSSSTKGPAFNTVATAGGLGAFTVSPSTTMPLVGTFTNVGHAVTSAYGVTNQ